VNNDLFALIAKLDENAKVVVKTPCGVTDPFNLKKNVLQDSVFGPIKCSVQIDTLGRDCLTSGDGVYSYKNIIDVPPLAMIDDVLGIAKCSDESIELNSIINDKIEAKKLRLSETKCYKIHVSKKPNECQTKLKAHDSVMKDVKKAAYLGDILNEEGNINDTISDRKNKSIGRINQITSMLSSVSLGFFYMDIALVFREAMLINAIITNSEVWYNVHEEHFKILESADNDVMRKIFDAHSKTACELFYLETGKVPIKFVIAKRRLNYLWQILTRKEDELIKKVYKIQEVKTTKGDWFSMIQSEKKKYEIDISDAEIATMSRYKFKTLVEKKVNNFVFSFLKGVASKHSKSTMILEESESVKTLKRKAYLQDNIFSKCDQQLLFKLRTKMLDVKTNFGELYQNNLMCRTCRKVGSVENEDHLLNCEALISENKNIGEVEFNFVYKNIEKQKKALEVFKAVLRKREVLLKYQENQ
jgi:hypothetical protein